MDPTWIPFLAAITAAPEDYTVREIFADFLDEQGNTEEANRQRAFRSADTWLRVFAARNNYPYDKLIYAGLAVVDYLGRPTRIGDELEFGETWAEALGNYFPPSSLYLADVPAGEQPGADYYDRTFEEGWKPPIDELVQDALNLRENREAYWKNWAVVTGRKVPGEAAVYNAFRCGCG